MKGWPRLHLCFLCLWEDSTEGLESELSLKRRVGEGLVDEHWRRSQRRHVGLYVSDCSVDISFMLVHRMSKATVAARLLS